MQAVSKDYKHHCRSPLVGVGNEIKSILITCRLARSREYAKFGRKLQPGQSIELDQDRGSKCSKPILHASKRTC